MCTIESNHEKTQILNAVPLLFAKRFFESSLSRKHAASMTNSSERPQKKSTRRFVKPPKGIAGGTMGSAEGWWGRAGAPGSSQSVPPALSRLCAASPSRGAERAACTLLVAAVLLGFSAMDSPPLWASRSASMLCGAYHHSHDSAYSFAFPT